MALAQDVPTKHQQPTLVDEDQAHTPQFSPPQITPSSQTLPSSSPQASLEIFHSRSYNPEHKPAPVPLKNKSKLEALRDEQADEQLVGPKPSLKRPRSLIQVESASIQLDDFVLCSVLTFLYIAGNGNPKITFIK